MKLNPTEPVPERIAEAVELVSKYTPNSPARIFDWPLTCREDTCANHHIDIQEHNSENANGVSHGRISLNGCPRGLLVGRSSIVSSLIADVVETAV
jgi:hypothetical protein